MQGVRISVHEECSFVNATSPAYTGFPPTWKVRENLKKAMESRELFLFLQKVRQNQGTCFKNANYHEIKKCNDFYQQKMLRLSFHAPGKTFRKLSKFVREICVQIRKKSQEFFFQILGENPDQSGIMIVGGL